MARLTQEHGAVKPKELDFGEETIDQRLTRALKRGISRAEDFSGMIYREEPAGPFKRGWRNS